VKPSKQLGKDGRHQQPAELRDETVKISFRHFDPGGRFCLSVCGDQQTRAYVECFRRITSMTYFDIVQTGRKGENKTGLNHTTYDDHVLRKVTRPPAIPAGATICGMRAGSKYRVFGFFHGRTVFCVLWFDPAHEIVPY